MIASCSGGNENASTEADPVQSETAAEQTKIETDASTEKKPAVLTEGEKKSAHDVDISDPSLTFVKEFPAPEYKTGDDLRKIVVDNMMKQASVEWIAKEDFTITWRPGTQLDFGVNLKFKKGEKYTGIAYTANQCTLDLFEQFIDNGKFSSDTYYYNDCVGNNCSGSIFSAINEIIDFTGSVGFKVSKEREGTVSFATELKTPEKSTWYSRDLFTTNGKEKIYEGYSKLGPGDILLKSISGSGHVRLVDHVNVKKAISGAINYAQSEVVCIEQTNAWDKERPGINSTWYVGHVYSFQTLYSTEFMPLTLDIYHEEAPVLKTAYITFDGKNTPQGITEYLEGVVASNFPLNYITLTVKNSKGETVRNINMFLEFKSYRVGIKTKQYELINGLEPGNYTFILRAGIGRGGCEIENFDFTVK